MKILSYSDWKKLDESSSVEYSTIQDLIINEAFSSGILKGIFQDTRFGGSKYKSTLAKDFYAQYKVDLESIQDSDFTVIHKPTKADTKELLSNKDMLGFWLNTNPEFVEKYYHSQGKTNDKAAIIMINRGPVALTVGFAYPSTTGRYGTKTPTGFVGFDKYQKEYYGWTGLPVTKMTSVAYHEMTDTLYVLNLADLQSKYSTEGVAKDRAEARKGAIALMSSKDLKAQNQSRYAKLKSEGLDPQSILDLYKQAYTLVGDYMTNVISNVNLENMKDIDRMQIKLEGNSSWGTDVSQLMSNLLRSLNDYANAYSRYAYYSKSTELISQFIETGSWPDEDDGTKASYYKDKLIADPSLAPQYYDQLDKEAKSFLVSLVPYKTKMVQWIENIQKLNAI